MKKYNLPNKSLSKEQISEIIASVHNSFEIGAPLNRFCTINLHTLAHAEQKDLLKNFFCNYRNYCQRKQIIPSYLWVVENKNIGAHVHILFHFPPTPDRKILDLKSKIKKKWFAGILNRKNISIKELINIKSVKIPDSFISEVMFCYMAQLEEEIQKDSEKFTTMQIAAEIRAAARKIALRKWWLFPYLNVVTLTAYLCKGVKKDFQGAVWGRRMGRSHNLICSKH